MKKGSIFAEEPAWLPSIITAVVSFFLIFIFAHLIELIGVKGEKGVLISYSLYGAFIVYACFKICKNYPKSIWYSIIICNATGVFPVTGEQDFWTSNMWIVFVCIWILSVISGIIGMYIGKHQAKEHKQ